MFKAFLLSLLVVFLVVNPHAVVVGQPGTPDVGGDEGGIYNDDLELGDTITNAPAPAPGDAGSISTNCFSGAVVVDVLRGKGRQKIPMSDLEIGDWILGPGATTYQEVYAFAHRDEHLKVRFLRIKTSSAAAALEVTPNHLIWRKVPQKEGGRDFLPVPAGTIHVGDTLLVENAEKRMRGNKKVAHVVTAIDTVVRIGIYAPLTREGTFLANGVAVSAYVSLQKPMSSGRVSSAPLAEKAWVHLQNGWNLGITQHFFIHLALTPFRVARLSLGGCHSTDASTTKMPLYVRYGIEVLHKIDNNCCVWIQVILLPIFFSVFGTLWTMEMFLGPSIAFGLLLATLLLGIMSVALLFVLVIAKTFRFQILFRPIHKKKPA